IFRGGFTDETSGVWIELVAKSKLIEIYIPVIIRHLHTRLKPEILGKLKIVRILTCNTKRAKPCKSLHVAGDQSSNSTFFICDIIIEIGGCGGEVRIDGGP